MTDEASRRVREIFNRIVDAPAEQQSALLREHCHGDPSLLRDVQQLLRADRATAGFLERPSAAAGAFDEAHDMGIPSVIGEYRVIRKIASGGMATVYLAEQRQPRRQVALKVMRLGMSSAEAQRRFSYESQLLARLHHPGIAQVFHAGTHPQGSEPLPYFAMEYIPNALPITDFSADRDLALEQRLELFAVVCDAVHHGHQLGVIHRDLKPSNILVDGDGRPRVIDFGIARTTNADVPVVTMETHTGQLMGTLQYMSPEQTEADPHRIGTASDVYSLGVVLYELLCRTYPYALTDLPLPRALETIRNKAATRPSQLDARLRGDLETIVLKTLEKEPDQRYRSASALADDVRRFLADDAIMARPPSTTYLLRIFVRRNRKLVAGAAMMLVSLVLGTMGTSIGLIRARHERDAARLVSNVLWRMLDVADPNQAKGRQVSVRTLLDEATEEVDQGEFERHPELEESIRTKLGEIYMDVGLFPEAVSHLSTVVGLLQLRHGENQAKIVEGLNRLNRARSSLVHVSPAPVVEFHASLNQTMDTARETLGPSDPATLEAMHILGVAYLDVGGQKQARALLEDVLNLRRNILGNHHPDTAETLTALGVLASWEEAEWQTAEQHFVEALRIQREYWGDMHPKVAENHYYLGNLYRERVVNRRGSDFSEAEQHLNQALAIGENVYGKHHRYINTTVLELARLRENQGRLDLAEALFRRTVQILRMTEEEGTRDVYLAWRLSDLSRLLRLRGRTREAETELREALRICRTSRDKLAPMAGVEILSGLGTCLIQQGRYEDAERELREALGEVGEGNAWLRQKRMLCQTFVHLYEAWGNTDQATLWKERLRTDSIPPPTVRVRE